MRLVPIPQEKYENYKQRLMFEGYKWDPQYIDNNTVAKYVLVLSRDEAMTIADYTKKLARETMRAEEFINDNLHLAKILELPKRLKKEIKSMSNYESKKHIRLMRFDFHPIGNGKYAVSEVNSDVPGGHAEGSIVPAIAKEVLEEESEEKYGYMDLSGFITEAIGKRVPANGNIFMNYCTCYSDDRQVMEFDGDRLRALGYRVITGAADHIKFCDGKAYSILDGNECELDGIFRYTPVEWVMDIRPKRWQGYFNTRIPCCNHPISLYAQTKRFPFLWEILENNGIGMSTWKQLLPKTVEVKKVIKDSLLKDEYIFKPAYGRVGERISIKEACKDNEYKKILKDVKRYPKRYIAQKRFNSVPLISENGEKFHVCIGSYSVDGEHAGFYARISDLPRIDSNAADIPVLIEISGSEDKSNDIEGLKIKIDTEEIYHNSYLKRQYSPELSWSVYKAFVPKVNIWSNWVRPVPFINIGIGKRNYRYLYEEQHIFDSKDKDMEIFTKETAIIVDMPGISSINAGMHLLKEGFRPIPLYNGTIEEENARNIVDNQAVSEGLMWIGAKLQECNISDDAKPAFLLDSNRLIQYKRHVSLYDNSWDIYAQDMPSAQYLKDNGVNRILLISERISGDLRKILLNYQKTGIEIYLKKLYEEPKRIKVRKIIRRRNK